MNITLSNGKTISIDTSASIKNPKAEAIEWLRQYQEGRDKSVNKDLADYTDEELQAFKDRLQAQRITGQGDGPSYQRTYRKAMLRKIDAELKRQGLPVADGRVYGVAAQIAVDKAAA